MYHYLPSYGFALIGTAGVLAALERKRPRFTLYFTLATLLCAAYFVPVWGEFLISEPTANARLVFPTWRP
jgi:dolichyl-phosphate-mannose--protein O-mannosyl transferase